MSNVRIELWSIDLTQPVVLTATPVFPPVLLAHSNQTGSVQVRMGVTVHTLDTLTATRLLRDLRIAVENSAGYPA